MPSGLDDRLIKQLVRLSPPVEPAPDLVRQVDRRRGQRRVMRAAGSASLAVVVVLGSIGGFVALQRAFREGPPPAISPAPGPDTAASLEGIWTVTAYADADAAGTLTETVLGDPTLTFEADEMTFAGETGCNSVGGDFTANGDTIEFSAIASTVVGCPGTRAAQEEAFLDAVTTAQTFEIEAGTLTLFGAGGEPSMTLLEGEPLPGQDLGLPFRLCSTERLGGVVFGEAHGAVWVGTKVEGERCPDSFQGQMIAATDVNDDGSADLWTAIPCRGGGCEPSPLGAVDIDADGSEEIFVSLVFSSTPQYQILTVVPSSGLGKLVPVTVGAVGHPEGGFDPGGVAVFMTGGDEGFAGRLQCEDSPEATVLSYVWSFHIVDSPAGTKELHRTRFALGDEGELVLLKRFEATLPLGQPVPELAASSRCGHIDLDPLG